MLLIENFFLNWSQCFSRPKFFCKRCPSESQASSVPVHRLASEKVLNVCRSSTVPSKSLLLNRSFRKLELVLCLSKGLLRSFKKVELVLCLSTNFLLKSSYVIV